MRPLAKRIIVSGILPALVFLSTAWASARLVFADEVEYGIAAQYPGDAGIADHPAVIHATGFETPQWAVDDFGYSRTLPEGYQHTADPDIVMAGEGSLQIQQTQGTHQPYEFQPSIRDSDTVYVRWYRRYEAGYDWTQHKMPGVYAKNPPDLNTSAGEKPSGCDKYSCKLFVDWSGRPAFYSYHPDQQGPYGDHFPQNIGLPVTLETERWYCFEMMIKSNTAGQYDGELKMWIDGILKGHVDGLRFRSDTCPDTLPEIKINKFTHSAYVGGSWVSQQDQKLWEDNLVIANHYIGPMVDTGAPAPGASPTTPSSSGGSAGDGGSSGGCFISRVVD